MMPESLPKRDMHSGNCTSFIEDPDSHSIQDVMQNRDRSYAMLCSSTNCPKYKCRLAREFKKEAKKEIICCDKKGCPKSVCIRIGMYPGGKRGLSSICSEIKEHECHKCEESITKEKQDIEEDRISTQIHEEKERRRMCMMHFKFAVIPAILALIGIPLMIFLALYFALRDVNFHPHHT